MQYANRISAGFDNQVSTFLVNHCEEDPGFEDTLQNLYAHYQKVHGSVIGNSFRKTWMTDSSFKNKLIASGLTVEIRPHAVHKKSKTIWVKGVRIIQSAKVVTAECAPVNKHYPPPVPIHHVAGDFTHVRVNGELYDRRLIARVKPIRPFEHAATGQSMAYIVTFNNAEIKHQFITLEAARELEHALGDLDHYRG